MTHPSNLEWWHFWCQGRNQAFLAWVEILFYVLNGILFILSKSWVRTWRDYWAKDFTKIENRSYPHHLPVLLRCFCWLFICGCVLCRIEPWEEGKSFSWKHVCRITVITFPVCEFQNDCMYNWPGKWWNLCSHDHLEISLYVLPHVPEIWKETGSLANQDLANFSSLFTKILF